MTDLTRPPLRWTIKSVLEWTADYFTSKGIASGRLDAEVLLAHCLAANRLHLYLNMDRPLLPDERSRFKELVRRRAAREPVALITGKKEFWSIELQTVAGILIPRPDTEILVEVILEEIRDIASPTVLEIGTGSGAVSVAVARERPSAVILASDIDQLAVSTARANALNAGVCSAIGFVACDLFSAISALQRFDVVCSNPPYIPRQTIGTLEPEISRFEPSRALDGGPDGLDIIRRIVGEARKYIKPGGALMLEIGESQEASVRELFLTIGKLRDIGTVRDLSGRPRVIKGRL